MNDLQQVILVPPAPRHAVVDPEGPLGHRAVVRSVVAASLAGLAARDDTPALAGAYRRWLSGPFTKSVRVLGKDAHLDRVVADDGALPVTLEGARAAVLHPTPVTDLPRVAARARVAGLDRPRGPMAWPAHGLVAVVDAGLGMSTGKTAAQVAHAAMIHALDTGGSVVPELVEVDRGVLGALAGDALAVVTDAGRTEVAPGTLTVVLVDAGAVAQIRGA